MLKTIRNQWFLLALTCAVMLGLVFWEPLRFLTDYRGARSVLVGTVMFLMAVPLPLSAFVRAFRRPQPAILASVLNLGLAPLVAWPFVSVLGAQLGGGWAIALSAPCTLATAAVWTRRAGGNDVTALMVTVLTNLTCVLVTPFWLWCLTSSLVENFSFIAQVEKLCWLVLVPIGLGQVLRFWKPVAVAATAGKAKLGAIAQFGVLYVVLVGTIQSMLAWQSGSQETLMQWAMLLSLVATTHLGLFGLGYFLARGLGFEKAEHSAVAISGSQKTFMVGAEMGLSLGLSILPLLLYHLFQLFADTLLADRIRHAQTQDPIVTTEPSR